MHSSLSTGARKELIQVLRDRYWKVTRVEKTLILNELVALTGWHRKHAIQAMSRTQEINNPGPRTRAKVYDEAVREALIVLWETSDRVCSKRLKAMIPLMVEALERHGHLHLEALVRARLLSVSPATIDRMLKPAREVIRRKRGTKPPSTSQIRAQVPVRTFADWGSPKPGFMEVDLVTHGGVKVAGDFLHTIVFTDIATGWTECYALPFRSSLLVVQAIDRLAGQLPFPLQGIDVDNGSEFLNEPLLDYCRAKGLEFTRARPRHKNDQAWVEQKNGAIVRRLLGYERLQGPVATATANLLYEALRFYVNYFQPSFKLMTKHRDGAKVVKKYHPPKTPCERLLATEGLSKRVRKALEARVLALDPLKLLHEIRRHQGHLEQLAERGCAETTGPGTPDIQEFLNGLSNLWKAGDLNPAKRTRHRRKPREEWGPVGGRRVEAVEMIWPQVEAWLELDPACSAVAILTRLKESHPAAFSSKQLRTIQRRVKEWRSIYAKRLVFGHGTPESEGCG